MSIVVLGCGPAGMLAAHAVVQAGKEPIILSHITKPSPIPGAVFLHKPIPGLPEQSPFQVKMEKVGTEHGYAKKVYGDEEAETSWSKFCYGPMDAWPLANTYEELWSRYGSLVRGCEIDSGILEVLARKNEIVISSIPGPAICHGGCDFPHRHTWTTNAAPVTVGENTMVYNGLSAQPWMRASDLFGVRATEYPHWIRGAKEGVKVLPTNCQCHPKVVKAGRWARWLPGILLHHVYEDVTKSMTLEKGAIR